ncbi:hypothetical protein [Alloalcanivorax gelatiniphagus]|uniref:Uncharacterized protein n=1 Tax=Alloalcanivorax gelatiniphagus TaxID=1194167 RepID=A0ABY2XPH4_9GAMM|nr:hypothetical protein [Alloalcanivorax gelatiniphagus]TMW14478.1 hypothetical protein FGS76_03000 [Alloalcanivorax gelatiniphagus]|tara:strand:+ start:6765 stop:7070 length:306 start_codon:yes stop_codon:yes gene_type:complete
MTTILLTAVITAAITLLALALWAHFYLLPVLRRRLRGDLEEEARNAADLIAARVEEAVKRGINDGVRNLPTREMIEETSRSLARTSTEMVGERLSRFFNKK